MKKCIRCKKTFDWKHPLDCVCPACLEIKPKLSTKEKAEMNLWDNISDFLSVFVLMQNKKWSWAANSRCKYVDLRIDMRDGGCIIRDREGNRISPELLAWQYSEETPNPPED